MDWYGQWLMATGLALIALGIPAAQDASPGERPFPPERAESPKKAEPAPTVSRGELLYENHCTACHTSRAHLRDNRRATSVPAVEGWVRRWSGELKLDWTDDDIKEVTQHLVRRYYKFDATPAR